MKEREIARELVRLREELAEMSAAAPGAAQRSEALGNSIAKLRADLLAMRQVAAEAAARWQPRIIDPSAEAGMPAENGASPPPAPPPL